jgi:DNA-binding NtrC family response regulator
MYAASKAEEHILPASSLVGRERMNPVRVLVVDDEELFRRSIGKELNRMGYSVRTAETSQKALAELHSFPPDVVLLDIRLPGQGGLELLRTIKDLDPSIEVIMLTASGGIDTVVSCMRTGAYHYLLKPATLTEIDTIIQKAYEKRILKIENRDPRYTSSLPLAWRQRHWQFSGFD